MAFSKEKLKSNGDKPLLFNFKIFLIGNLKKGSATYTYLARYIYLITLLIFCTEFYLTFYTL